MRRTAIITFYVTAAATLAANAYTSEHTAVGVFTGLWAPLALFLALELVERSLRVAWARLVVGFLALVAGWTSYVHLVEVFTEGGADGVSRWLLPLTVDGLMVVARAAMVDRPTPPTRQDGPVHVEATVEPANEPVAIEAAEEREGGFINHRIECTHPATPAARKACREARRQNV